MSNPIFWQDKKVNFKISSAAIELDMLCVKRLMVKNYLTIKKTLSILNYKFDIVIFFSEKKKKKKKERNLTFHVIQLQGR